MIENIVIKRLVQCPKIIIEDAKYCRGYVLLKCFILHKLKSGIKVVLLLFEQSESFMLEGLEGYSNLVVHNMSHKHLNNDFELKKEVEALATEPHILIIDSISRVALSRSDPFAFYFFQRDNPKCETTISVMHHTTEPKSFVESMEKLSNAVIRLQSENSSLMRYKAHLNIKVKGKKRTLFSEEFSISNTYAMTLLNSETIKLKLDPQQDDWYVSEADTNLSQKQSEIQYFFDKGDDFDEDEAFDDFGEEEQQLQSTFELHIKEDEMEAKKQLVLPFSREAQELAKQRQAEEQSEESSDEDPDADLDI